MTKSKTHKGSSSKQTYRKHTKTPVSVRSNPRRLTTPIKRSLRPRSFYVVSDDAKILQVLQKVSSTFSKSQACKNLAKELGRSAESIRDRIKRYLGKLSSSDKKQILSYLRKAGTYYIHWTIEKGFKSVDFISTDTPGLLP